ncbi:bifunctional histidinol-phosphatase/imidazoleglycerol-phosphate dehydratase HisB [Pseudobacteriovorax antillogorgiicola]|uniref:Histidine biosynthesis bifunctional protein HisB n=1 Tax=Pseudobacteriovorax antillogorgiicola TaxID=1513793 RepID=A0A1Y6CNX1_9BACT|nr:bifunctional histidinol-phosphatase/imidazoleglycerol-phosphate dehydratase HisB [Pseudobacteriovorax antillogorgiicola]TCS44614.1 imidazoleglycerol-phosphate dehydratase [Pseudobacteriovorax antillogorgiicola]SMF78305.1 imidazoleglycerol-phosphate dehydratase [Pseudobacteriovorax antillogorgiicola]
MKKLLFIDRDGTICKEPEDEQVDRIDKIELLTGVIPSLLKLQSHGYTLVMISNQDGLGTESFPQEDFDVPHQFLMKLLQSQGIQFETTLICPHLPSDQCGCRKPNLDLVLPYLQDPHWDRDRSAVIGDRDSDLLLAERMGIRGIRVNEPDATQGASWDDIAHELTSLRRQATVSRKTKETAINIEIDLDRTGLNHFATGIGFFDHMLEQLPKHGGFSLKVACEGDLHIDDHHTVEDIGLALGQCFRKALGDKIGIQRYGFVLPMDESEAKVSLDLGGRPYFIFKGEFKRDMVGELATEMVPHFFRSFAESLGANLHMSIEGGNDHHKVEGLFKGLARTLRQAVKNDQSGELPSTKGML